MNLLGIGNLELIMILLVALVILGPGRMVDAARATGKFWREAQRVLRAAADAATVDLDATKPAASPPFEPIPGPRGSVSRTTSSDLPHAENKGEHDEDEVS